MWVSNPMTRPDRRASPPIIPHSRDCPRGRRARDLPRPVNRRLAATPTRRSAGPPARGAGPYHRRDPGPDRRRAVPVADTAYDRGHGRAEIRRLQVTTIAGLDFPYATQALRITRRVRPLASRRRRTVTVYAVTSLTDVQTRPARLADYPRGHWGIAALRRAAPQRPQRHPSPAAPPSARQRQGAQPTHPKPTIPRPPRSPRPGMPGPRSPPERRTTDERPGPQLARVVRISARYCGCWVSSNVWYSSVV
jgi:hypothetical protein